MSEQQSFHMKAEAFRQHAHEAIEWIIRYREQLVSELPVLSSASPGSIRAQLPEAPPAHGESFGDVLEDLNKIIFPGLTHWQSPSFHAFFPANASYPSILGELISAGLGVQGMLWATSPACTELETHVLDWLAQLLGLPDTFQSAQAGGGVIQDSASSASLCAVLAARACATSGRATHEGAPSNLMAYASTEAHASIEKAVGIAGIGRSHLRQIAVDEGYAMSPAALQDQIRRDRNDGLFPFFVCATVGTTSSYAFDALPEIGEICRAESVWLHVDAAMAGTAALCPEYRTIQQGIEYADSYCFNPHKWMFTNFDCDCFFVRDRAPLITALSILPEYLRNRATESGAVIDYRDWQIPLGRRFRALKLWFVLRHYGVEGLRYHIRRHVDLAQEFRQWIISHESLELAAPSPLNLVCFRHKRGNDATRTLHERLNRSGQLYLTHTVLDGRYVLRFCVGQTKTEKEHIETAWQLIHSYAQAL
jgi:aromatic-L-amino-acid/L-tryptophan decarboxylase